MSHLRPLIYALVLGAVFASPPSAQADSRLVNISTRSRVELGDNVMIAGFIIEGTSPKTVLVRATGPSLTAFGVPGVLTDPFLLIFSGQTAIAENDDWQVSRPLCQQSGHTCGGPAEITATGLAPSAPLEAAVLITLNPGPYTAIISGFSGTTGVGLVEVFEVGADSSARLVNISTRARVETGDDVMIAGFIIEGDTPKTVLVRAIGPSLASFGVPGVLANPFLRLFSSQTAIAQNDDWQVTDPVCQAIGCGGPAAIATTGSAPSHPLEAAVLITLVPGPYTAIVSGVGGSTGVGLVEVFEVGATTDLFTLTVNVQGSGTGTVTSSPVGVNCATGNVGACSASFASGTSVTLTATPSGASTRGPWGGDCAGAGTASTCTLTMTTNKNVTATFNTPGLFTLSVNLQGSGTGTVTSSPAGIICGTDCSESYASGTSVTLTATPASGSIFAGWTGACSGTSTCTLTMNAAKTVTATFAQTSTLGILNGAKNYTGAYPTPGLVNFTTKDGRSVQVKAFPGQVQVFAQATANQATVESGIVSKGGTVLSKVPLLGYYLAGVTAGTEGTFISSIRSTTGIVDAVPNTAVSLRADAVLINEDYFLTEKPVPLNVGPGVIVMDQEFNAGGHGNDVANTVTAIGGTVGALVNLAIQCVGCTGETSAHHIGLILAAAIQGNSVFNPGTSFIGNISFGPELPDDLLAEQATAAQVAANQAENESFIRSILSVTGQIPAAQDDFTVTFALGNSHVNLTGAMASLRGTRDLAAELHDHFILAGTNQPFSNFVNGRDLDVVVSNNPQAAHGTSFAAPAMGAVLQVVRNQMGTSREVAQLAIKLIDDVDGQVTVARVSAMATQIANEVPQIMAAAGVTEEQALLAIEHAVRANPSGQLVLQEATDEAFVLKDQGGCCVSTNGCPGETGTECGATCCCCDFGQRCCADITLGCCFVGFATWLQDVIRLTIGKLPFISSYFPQPVQCPPRRPGQRRASSAVGEKPRSAPAPLLSLGVAAP